MTGPKTEHELLSRDFLRCSSDILVASFIFLKYRSIFIEYRSTLLKFKFELFMSRIRVLSVFSLDFDIDF
ncbi:unnamed protein product [Camellia sinensis]